MIKLSAWEDYTYTASTDDFRFYIVYSGETIYSGRAIAKPDSGVATVNVMPILRDFLNDECPDDWDFTSFSNDNVHMYFEMYDEKDSLVETFSVIYCWDYTTMYSAVWDITPYSLSSRINNHKAVGMKEFDTLVDGHTTVTTFSGSTDYCNAKAAIYFISSKGGWSSFLIEGRIKRSENFERYEYESYADANSMQFGRRNITNKVTTVWELNTHIMSDQESKMLNDSLIGTTQAFLHTFDDNVIRPIVLTDKSFKCLTYSSNGNKVFGYTIKCEESQTKTRR